EGLNLFPAGISERLRAAEVDGVGLYEFGVELVLADDLTQAVPNFRATAVPVSIHVLGRMLLSRTRNRPDLLDRADADAIGLAEGSIDRPSFRYPHFRTVNQRRNIGGVGIAVADEARRFGFVNRSSENPATHRSFCCVLFDLGIY